MTNQFKTSLPVVILVPPMLTQFLDYLIIYHRPEAKTIFFFLGRNCFNCICFSVLVKYEKRTKTNPFFNI
jgi:hypothetical protein